MRQEYQKGSVFAARTPLHMFVRRLKRRRLERLLSLESDATRRIERNSELNQRELWHSCVILRSRPRVIQVGTNLFCNLRCSFCRLNQPETASRLSALSREQKEVSDKVVGHLLELLPYCERMTLTPLGEPLVWSRFGEFMDAAYRIGSGNLEITSNGMLLEKFAPMLTRSHTRHITLSVDTNDPSIYAGMRVGGDLAQVERGLCAVKANGDPPKVTIAATFMRRNIEQLPSMVEWAQALGADVLAVQLMDTENPAQESEHLSHYPDLTKEMLTRALAAAKASNFDIFIAVGMRRYLEKLETIAANPRNVASLVDQCTDPWSELLIDTDGDCRPCCWAGISYGNLNTAATFDEVWNSVSAQETRRQFLTNTLPEGCRDRHCRIHQPRP